MSETIDINEMTDEKTDRVLLQLQHVTAGYGRTDVIRDISLMLRAGECLAIAGESGSGKSTLLKCILPLPGQVPAQMTGTVLYRGQDITEAAADRGRYLAGAGIGMVFQDPRASYNELRSYGRQFAETLKSHGRKLDQEMKDEMEALFHELHLPPAEQVLKSYPCRLSGGMNQRISIALSVLLKPQVLLADEPTSALDMVSQKQVIDQLLKLREREKLAILMVTHNLGAAARLGDRIAVMKAGRIVESGDTRQILAAPQHPYTRELLAAVPQLDGGMRRGIRRAG